MEFFHLDGSLKAMLIVNNLIQMRILKSVQNSTMKIHLSVCFNANENKTVFV